MVISIRELQLETVKASHLHLLRQWRNSEKVNRYLITRDFITPCQQLEWFASLDFAGCIYFVITYRSKPVGLVYAHKINEQTKSFEGSIFIGDPAYESSFVPVQAILLLKLFFFNHLGFKLVFSTVHKENIRALELDRKLGFQIFDRDAEVVMSQCTKEDFFTCCEQMLQVLLTGPDGVKFHFDEDDKKYTFMGKWSEMQRFEGFATVRTIE